MDALLRHYCSDVLTKTNLIARLVFEGSFFTTPLSLIALKPNYSETIEGL